MGRKNKKRKKVKKYSCIEIKNIRSLSNDYLQYITQKSVKKCDWVDDDDDYGEWWYTGYESKGESMDPNDSLEKFKRIYFYTDIDKCECEIFYDIHEFGQYLDDNNIIIDDDKTFCGLMYSDIIHCCINPIIYRNSGELELLIDYTYMDLKWSIKDMEKEEYDNNKGYMDIEYEESLPF